MAAPRTYWKGHLRLSLVSIDVALYSATDRSGAISLRQLHRGSGKPIKYEKTAPGIGPVEEADIIRGYDLGDDSFVVLEPDEIDEIKLESSRAIRLVQFVDQGDIDPRYHYKPYYLTPQGEAATEGFVVIRDALRGEGKVGIGQMTMRGKEHLVSVRPCGRGLLLTTLRYGDEVRASDAVFNDIPEVAVDEEMLAMARELIERRAGPFEPRKFRDSYAVALRALIDRKRAGRAIVAAEDAPRSRGGEVIDLMDALKRSLREGAGGGGKAGGGGAEPAKPAAKKPASGKPAPAAKSPAAKSPAAKSPAAKSPAAKASAASKSPAASKPKAATRKTG